MPRRPDDQGELLKGNTPTLILAVLSHGPRHGYGIAREVKLQSTGALSLGEGSLYPALRALERDGLVTSSWEPQESGPARKVYTLTEAGHTVLADRTRTWKTFVEAMARILGWDPHAHPA